MARMKPVYVFSGFLDAGKTTAIKESLLDPGFNQGETTLIIAFEQGDEEYDEDFLFNSNSYIVYLDDKYHDTETAQAARRMLDAAGVKYEKYESSGRDINLNL